MTTTAHPESVARPADTPAELATFGPVHLDVIDRDRSLHFWSDVVGLRLVADDGDAVSTPGRGSARRRRPRHGASLNHRARSTTEGTP